MKLATFTSCTQIERPGLGFASRDADKTYEKMKANLMNEVTRHFRPEFLNRLDDVMIWNEVRTAEQICVSSGGSWDGSCSHG